MEATQKQQGFDPQSEHEPADPTRPESRLQSVADADGERSAEEEALIDQWLAERQCSGL